MTARSLDVDDRRIMGLWDSFGRFGEVEVDASRGPFLIDLDEDGADQSQERLRVWEEGGNACSAFDLLIESFDGVACSQSLPVLGRNGEHGEGLGDIGFDPVGEFGRGFAMLVGDDRGASGGLVVILCVEYGSDVACDLCAHGLPGNRLGGIAS